MIESKLCVVSPYCLNFNLEDFSLSGLADVCLRVDRRVTEVLRVEVFCLLAFAVTSVPNDGQLHIFITGPQEGSLVAL